MSTMGPQDWQHDDALMSELGDAVSRPTSRTPGF